MNRIQALFEIFEAYLNIETDEDWLDYLEVAETSTISRYRNSKRKLPEKRIKEICRAVGITRADFDKSLAELATQLQVVEHLPAEVLNAEVSALVEDVALIQELRDTLLVIYHGLDPDDRDQQKIWIDSFEVFQKGKNNSRKVKQMGNKVLKSDFEGFIKCDRGIVSLQIAYPGLHYPNSNYLFEPIFKNFHITIFSGILLDINGGMKDRIFATQCCMVSANFGKKVFNPISQTDERFPKWFKALDNKIERRGKLMAKIAHEDVEYLRDLVFESFEI